MGHRKSKTPRMSFSVTGSAITSEIMLRESPGLWIRDPTRSMLLDEFGPSGSFVNGPKGQFTFSMPYRLDNEGNKIEEPEPMKPQTIFQQLRTMATDPFYAIRTHWELSRKQELEQIALGLQAKKQEKKNENLEIKGKYRERIKELTDEITALKYENEQLKKEI